MKKKYFGIACLLGAFLCLGVPATVYAGDINAAEQELINYYSGTFYHDGKAYRATSSAISQATAKLMADDVNLTPEEVAIAKRRIRNSVKQGIDEGHLVEVDEDAGEDDPDPGKEDPGADPENPDPGKEDPGADPENPDPGEEDPGKNPGKPDDGGKPGDGKKDDGKDDKNNKIKNTGEKIDVNPLLDQAEKDDNLVITRSGNDGTLYTIQDYTTGKIISTAEDGTILYQGELPVKNTGYQSKNLILWTTILMGIFLCNLIAAIVFVRRGKGDRHGA